MSSEAANPSRRIFLGQAGGALFLSACHSIHQRNTADRGRRELLAEPAPMLPPVPAVLLTVRGFDDGPDEISVVWTFVLNGDPPQIGVSVAHEHVAGPRIQQHGEFVLNVPARGIAEHFDRVDMSSTKVSDKYALSGLTRGRAVAVDAPTVEESPIHVECRVIKAVELPPKRTVHFAEVVATTVHPGVCDESGMLLVPRVPFFGMTAGSGEFFTMGRRVGHIGATKGVPRGKFRY